VRAEDCAGEGYCVAACGQSAIRLRRVRLRRKVAASAA
jgi:ferredoxin